MEREVGNQILEVNEISKTVEGRLVLDKVSFMVNKNDKIGFIGDELAITTLFKILAGEMEADSGSFKWGVTTSRSYFPKDNTEFFKDTPYNLIDWLRQYSIEQSEIYIRGFLGRMLFSGDEALKPAQKLSGGEKRRLNLIKMLYENPNFLIFDEPTAVLTPAEIKEFLAILKNLQAEGKTILLITHKLNEIMAVANRCSIIRRGEYYGTVEIAETTKEKLASLMIGKDLEIIKYERSREGKKNILEVSGVYADTTEKKDILHDFNLNVREREILGIAGVDGNGQQQFVEVLNALLKETKGKIIFDGKEINSLSTAKRKELGLEIIAEDRHKDGLVLDFSVEENSVLENYYTEKFSNRGFLKKNIISKFAKEICEKYDVRKAGDEKISARSMSGGNQQKLIIGRALELDPKLLVTTQPTRGLDVGAINGIHKMLINYRDKGNGVLLISFDLDEILTLSDRIAVIHNGNIIDVVDNDENVTKEQLGLLMAGVKK